MMKFTSMNDDLTTRSAEEVLASYIVASIQYSNLK